MQQKNYKIQLPFKRVSKGILIDTYWGEDKIKHVLLFDNHSPTWANNDIIANNQSIRKSKDFLYKTTTADGTHINGDVYVCDSLTIGNLAFKQVTLYEITSKNVDGTKNEFDGVLGNNILATSIWKIDFKHKILTVTSSLDSLEGMQEAQELPANLNNNIIEFNTSIFKNINKKFEMDLGLNRFLVMPLNDFNSVYKSNKVLTDSVQFSTPGSSNNIKNFKIFDSIKIGNTKYSTIIMSNNLIKETCIGLPFFERFEFIILDYLNKAIYVSKNKFY